MARQNINIGTSANSGTGDPLRTAFTKTNQNFTELYTAVGTIPSNTNQLTNGAGFITISSIPSIPSDVSDLTDNQGLLGQGSGNIFDENGVLQLPDGGAISEDVVTDNPTINLTPANPEVESQKLVIKGGVPGFSNSENGITITTYNLRVTSGDTAYFEVFSEYPGETFYWWVDTFSPGQEFSPDNGEITLNEFGFASIEFTVNDDTVPLRIYVADTLYNAYANNKGSVSVTVNEGVVPDLYHLHLTTGDLQETSVILGTDEHNVRTKIDCSVDLTSYDYDNEQTYRLNFKNNVLKISSTDNEGDEDLYIKAEDDLYLDALDDDIHIRASDDIRLRPGYNFADSEVGYELRFTDSGNLIFYNGNEGNDYGYIRMYNDGMGGPRTIGLEGDQDVAITSGYEGRTWTFDTDGNLTFPREVGKINSSVSDGTGLQIEAELDFEVKVNDGQGGSNIWSFAGSDITFPDATIQTTAWSGGRVVEVPSTSMGTEGDEAGDIAFSSSYLYYCIQNYSGPAPIGMTVLASSGTTVWVNSNQYDGDLVADFTANSTGWTYNGVVITNVEVSNTFGPGYQLSASTSWGVNNGITYNLQAPGVDNIWKRVAWSNDTW